MAVLNPNEIFFTAFEPKQTNRFIMYIDGIPSYEVKGVGGINVAQGTVAFKPYKRSTFCER
jgi:regulatory protein YycH of two-component signal transduction system YycFG